MKNKHKHLRNGLFFLIGLLIYSLLFWLTGRNPTRAFLMILVALACNILYKMDRNKERIKTKDVIYMCAGALVDSMIRGFPFGLLHLY